MKYMSRMTALFSVGFPTLPFLYMCISYLGNNNNNTVFITSELTAVTSVI